MTASIEPLGGWYHELELEPGVVTGGKYPHSIPATRAILKNVQVNGAHVVDIGAMEGLFSILAKRRGAGPLVATDRYNHVEKVTFAQRKLDVSFDYAPKTSLHEVGGVLDRLWGRRADFVIFSGVLYHMFDPLGGLLRVRALVRPNGLVIVETIAVLSDESSLIFNDRFRIYGPSTYFIPTTGALGAMLPFVGLTPIDCRYFAFGSDHSAPMCRIAICCRATDLPVLAADPPDYAKLMDSWYQTYGRFDYGEYVDLDRFDQEPRSPIGYDFVEAGIGGPELRLSQFMDWPGKLVSQARTSLMLGELE